MGERANDLTTGVDLPASHRRASAALIEVVRRGAERVPALAQAAAALRREALGETLVRFEAARAALPAPDRLAAARAIVEASEGLMQCAAQDGGRLPLAQCLARDAATSRVAVGALHRRAFGGGGLEPQVPWHDGIVKGRALASLADAMLAHYKVSPGVVDAMHWLAGQPALDLSGERFVVMGAAAEIAPTELLLRGGAEVLFVDLASPERWLARGAPSAGALAWPERPLDLLADPGAALATILAFAGDRPVHLGLFGYAGAANREWRLAASMNAIVRAMPPALVKSIGLYVSPTAPAQACDGDAVLALARARHPSFGERLWRAAGVIRPGVLTVSGRHWPRSVVAMQGASYLAAQYVEKRLAAEVFALGGLGPGVQRPIVSAQIAGVTRTASMDIPAFNAALVGAAVLGVESYPPATTRWLSGLVYLENLLNPASRVRLAVDGTPGDLDRVHAMQVHGGLYAHPWATDGALKRAAVIGLRHRPSLIPALLGGARRR